MLRIRKDVKIFCGDPVMIKNEERNSDIGVDTFTGRRRFGGEIPEQDDILNVAGTGKGLVLEADRKVDFTRAVATKILEAKEFPGERRLRDDHVIYLNSTMKRETFRAELVRLITCTCKEDDLTYRMNGNHTCWALLEMPEDYVCPGKVTLSHYVAKTFEDVRILYTSIDRGASRTRAHVIMARLAGIEQFVDLKREVVRVLSQGYSFYKWANASERNKHDGDDVAFLMQGEDKNIVSVMVAYLKTFSVPSVKWLTRAPVMGAMFTTFEKDPEAARLFWDSVREATGFTEVSDPRRKLRDELMTKALMGGRTTRRRGGRKEKNLVISEEMYHWSIHAWNAWRSGKTLQSLRAFLGSKERPKAK